MPVCLSENFVRPVWDRGYAVSVSVSVSVSFSVSFNISISVSGSGSFNLSIKVTYIKKKKKFYSKNLVTFCLRPTYDLQEKIWFANLNHIILGMGFSLHLLPDTCVIKHFENVTVGMSEPGWEYLNEI